MMDFPFSPTKATQAAAWLVSKSGGKMSHIKLSKLLYIADREALRRWGRPIIGGRYSSMEHGPVISPVVDRLKKLELREEIASWDAYLQREGNNIVLIDNPGRGQLHNAAIGLLDQIFEQCRKLTKWDVRDLTHKFPEYKDPGKSSRAIKVAAILEAVDKSGDDIEALSTDSQHLHEVRAIIGC